MTGLGDDEFETAAEMVAGLGAGQITAAELVQRALIRAEACQSRLNAFSQLWPEEALATAWRIDRRHTRDRPVLAGVPVAVKELFDVAGHETHGCSEAYRTTVAETDATIIDRIRRAGLVIVGKTNQHELAAGGTNLISASGRTGNPWDPTRMTGGSSGGAAAAVAAGIVPWCLGSDTGGSIRIPSALCGVFGLKPTTGSLPIHGMMPLAPSMDCPGAIATTVIDLTSLHAAMAGELEKPGPGPPIALQADQCRAPVRVAVPEGFFAELIHHEVARAVETTAASLERAGVRVQPVDGRGIEDAPRLWMQVCAGEFVAAHPALRDPTRRTRVHPSVVEWLSLGERLTSEERESAFRGRERVASWYRERLVGHDALLIPTTPYPAPPTGPATIELGHGRAVAITQVGPGRMTSSVNLAGLPAITVPAAWSSEGMPIGVSLVGHPGGERTLLALARLWEIASSYRPRRP